jgi:hypothetical protein
VGQVPVTTVQSYIPCALTFKAETVNSISMERDEEPSDVAWKEPETVPDQSDSEEEEQKRKKNRLKHIG